MSARFTSRYASPLGEIFLASDGEALIGLWFFGQRFFPNELFEKTCAAGNTQRECAVFDDARRWLDIFFTGTEPDFTPRLNLIGTEFQRSVWEILMEIPFGETATYGEIAQTLSLRNVGAKVSARAVGSAVGRNPISLIVPCHRVIGVNGTLCGYAAGLTKKSALLSLESRTRKLR